MNHSLQLKRRKRPISGFTLVELQISMVIMSLIAVLMGGALQATVRTWQKATERQDIAEKHFMVSQFLRRHLGAMRFSRFQYEQVGTMVSFMGGGEAVHFVAPYPGISGNGSLYWWTLKNQWIDEFGKEQLVLEFMPYSTKDVVEYSPDTGLTIEKKTPGHLVLDESIRLQSADYFVDDDEVLDGWRENWEPSRRIPGLVRLRLVQINVKGNEIPLPEIVIAPHFKPDLLAFGERK